MLTLHIHGEEKYDEVRDLFIPGIVTELKLEHSLLSLSKWESIWKVPFLGNRERTAEQSLSYIECMTIGRVNPLAYSHLTPEHAQKVADYINDPMTATTFRDNGPGSREIVTSELIYYWMATFSIPFECEKWHLNRLMTLIRVCGEKNKDPKKMSRAEIARQNRSLNAARRAKMGSKG